MMTDSISWMRAYMYILLITCFISLSLVACSGSGGTSSGSSGTATQLGTLPNGSTVYISSANFTAVNTGSTSGSLNISGGTSGESYTFSFSISPNSTPAPTIVSNPTPCIVTSGNTAQNSCQLTFSSNSATAQTYTITTYYESSGTLIPTPLPGTFTFIVTGNTPIYESGTLMIMPLSVESIESGFFTTATVSLSNSQGITTSNPVVVAVFSNQYLVMNRQLCR